MIGGRLIHIHLICLFLLLPLVPVSVLAQETVRVLPEATDELLINPGMGFATFQHFNGDSLFSGGGWSEEGPLTFSDEIKTLVNKDYPPTSLSYCRWYWDVLEPEKGKYAFEILDNALLAAHRHGQTLQIRLMPQAHVGAKCPEWYVKEARGAWMESRENKVWQPDYTDPKFMEYWGNLIRAFGRRYDGHPWLEHVDIGAFGFWGEWHTLDLPAMPPWEIQRKMLDIYLESFTRTPLLMNLDGKQGFEYTSRHGAGWRVDCWGDLRRDNWNHQYDRYPQYINQTGSVDAWKTAPVVLETCGTYGSWYKRGLDLDFIHEEALRWHSVAVHGKSSAIPREWMPKVEEFLKKLGYRFELRKLQYPSKVTAGKMMPIQMWWVNVGCSPVYRRYNLAIQLKNERGGGLIRIDTNLKKWLPGDDQILESPVWAPDLEPGKYKVRVGLLDPFTGKPGIKLPLKGRTEDNWHDLGEIELVKWDLQ